MRAMLDPRRYFQRSNGQSLGPGIRAQEGEAVGRPFVRCVKLVLPVQQLSQPSGQAHIS